MADTTDSEDAPKFTQEELDAALDAADTDLVLAQMIGMVESSYESNLEEGALEGVLRFGVTLNVGGVIVTGLMCSYPEWAEAIAASMGDASDVFRSFLGIGDDSEDPAETKEIAPWDRRAIHLIEAKQSHGSSLVPTNAGIPWRGRLRDVNGWSMGTLARA
jgi:hypothetical protein